MHSVYYNEIEPFAAAWLRNLIAAGHIAAGDVDERDIRDVRPDDLRNYTQCHFFAGIGVWSYALRLAGWPDDRPVWTGSCPCQPFSAAGKGAGFDDERHLWPHWFHLISRCRPRTIFGEQVASKDGLGWLDLVSSDLAWAGYAGWADDLCAASVGAPHIRQRLWFVGNAERDDMGRVGRSASRAKTQSHSGREVDGAGRVVPGSTGAVDDLGHALGERLALGPFAADERGVIRVEGSTLGAASTLYGAWDNPDWIYCTDGKWRPVEPGSFPLAHGSPKRVGRLRAYGNAIVPQVAAQFIEAYLEAELFL